MTKPLVKVTIGIPDKGITEALPYDNHLEFMHALGKLQARSEVLDHYAVQFQFFLVTLPRIFPALARERIADRAVDVIKSDYLLMFDDDMLLPMDLFERLYVHNVDIVAALAFTRLPPFKPVMYNLVSGWDGVEKMEYYLNYGVQNYPKDRLVECDAVGFGAVLIKCSVIDKMKKPWFMTTSGAGEDIHFCHMARRQGFRVFMDTSVKCGHLGEPPVITEETYESQPEVKLRRETQPDEVKYPQDAA